MVCRKYILMVIVQKLAQLGFLVAIFDLRRAKVVKNGKLHNFCTK